MSRFGFTQNQAFSEIFTNSIDEGSTDIIVEKNKIQSIKIHFI